MLVVIRIRGGVGIKKDIENTLFRLRLRKKFSCVLLHEKKEIEGMLAKVKYYIAYGKINDDALKELVEKRGRKVGNKAVKREEIADILNRIKKDTVKDIGIKPFFALHPPRGGFKKSTRLGVPKGILGNNGEKINLLLKRML